MTASTHASLPMSAIGQVVSKLLKLKERLPPGEREVVEDLLKAAGVVEAKPLQYNPYLPGVHINPYPHYHRLQADNPVHWSEAMQAWVVCRHEDVVAAFRDSRLSYRTGFETTMACVPSEEHDSVRAVSLLLGSLLNEIDPPDHTRLRRIMTRALTTTVEPQRISHIESIANKLIDAVESAGRMDIVDDFAYPLPAIVGADLLGIPAEDREKFGQWIDDVVHTFSEGFSGTTAMLCGEAAVGELTEYLRKLFAQRRARPGEDALSAMLQATEATEDERVLIAINLIMGMHENVTHAISLSMQTILRDPEILAHLRSRTDDLSSAVEEMLRHEGTAPILSRVALEDIELGGIMIPKGQRVILLLAAANRDQARFDEPDCFIPDRQPNPHVAFGVGKRACPGSGLARTMIQVAVRTLITRLPDMQLMDTEPMWREEINIHGLRVLPVKFTPRGLGNNTSAES
jgi:cytochrome P450